MTPSTPWNQRKGHAEPYLTPPGLSPWTGPALVPTPARAPRVRELSLSSSTLEPWRRKWIGDGMESGEGSTSSQERGGAEDKRGGQGWLGRVCNRRTSSGTVTEAAWGSGDAHVPSIATRQSRPQAVGAPRCSALSLWLHLEAKSEHALGPGATIGILGMGVPRLACLRPVVWLKGGPSMAHLHQHRPKTLARGQASRGG